jgi:hypothetical protein
MAAVMS